jgi:hypothetical protein
MGQGGSFEIGSQILDACRRCALQIRSQRICPDFVQVQTVIQYFCVKSMKAIDINEFSPEFVPPSYNM